MASFKYLIFFAMAVYTVTAEETNSADNGARVKKQAYIAAAPIPVLSYSASVPAAYPYAYSAYPGYPYSYSAATYPAATSYAAAAPTFATYPAGYAAYPSYYQDDGKYWPGKYENTYYPAAYRTAYPVAYHY